MQQAVRDSVAVLFEGMMEAIDRGVLEANRNAMAAVLSAGGNSVKDVSDWIRREPVAAPPVVVTSGTVPHIPVPRGWAPAAKARLPKDPVTGTEVEESDACYMLLTRVTQLLDEHDSALASKETSFLVSLRDRLVTGRWLSVKQLQWFNVISSRLGLGTLTT